jgi:ABC-2 type transport system permease protein
VKYLAIARLRLMSALIYNRDVLVRSLFMLVAMVVFVQLWTTTYSTTNQSVIQGFGLRDIVWYLVITEVIALSTPVIAQNIDAEVRSGDIAYILPRPYSYPLYNLAAFWGETLVRLPLNFAVGSVVAWLAVGPPPTSGPALLASLVLMTGAISLKGMLEILVGFTAFWVEDTLPAQWIYSKFLITIGGIFLPLDLFPDWLAAISRALPFASVTYAPARVFVSLDWTVFGPLLATQLAWIALCWLTIQVVFSFASRRLVAHGG